MTETRANLYPYIGVAVCCCFFAACSIGLPINCAGLFYSAIAEDMSVGIGSISLATSITATIAGVCSPVSIALYQRIDARVIFSGALLAAVSGMLGVSATKALWHLYMCAGIIGFSVAFFNMATITFFLSGWFDRGYGLVVGIAQSFSGISGALFSQIIGRYLSSHGWRSSYILMAVIFLLLVLPAFFFLTRCAGDKGLPRYGQSEAVETDNRDDNMPTPPKRVLVICCFIAGLSCFVTGMPSHLANFSNSLGLPAAVGVFMLSAAMVSNFVAKASAGFLCDKTGARLSCQLMLFLAATGFLGLSVLADSAPIFFYVFSFLLGCSYAVYGVGLSSLLREIFPRRSFAMMYSYVQLVASLGSAVAFSAIGYSFDLFGGYRITLICCAAFVVACMFLLKCLPRSGKNSMESFVMV